MIPVPQVSISFVLDLMRAYGRSHSGLDCDAGETEIRCSATLTQGGAVAPQENNRSEMEVEVDWEQIEGVHQYMQFKTGCSNFLLILYEYMEGKNANFEVPSYRADQKRKF